MSAEPRLGKVAVLTNFIPPYRRPMLLELAHRCEALRIFVCTRREPNRVCEVNWEGLDVLHQKSLTLSRPWMGDDRVFVHVPVDTLQRLREFSPDTILSAEMGFRSAFSALYRKLNPQARLLIWADVSLETEAARGGMRRALRSLLLPAADGFIVNGTSGRRYLEKAGVPTDRITAVPLATDPTFMEAAARKTHEARHLLYVGQLIERKGLLPFLEALRAWAASHGGIAVRFTIVGDGPLRSRIESAANPPNLQINFRGAVAYERLPEIYAAASVLVMPTLADTWGVVVNEGMAAGLPVLGSVLSPAVQELLADGVSGWTFDPRSREQVQSAISRSLAARAEELEKMGRAAHAAAARLTPAYVAGLLEEAMLRRACPVRNAPAIPVDGRPA